MAPRPQDLRGTSGLQTSQINGSTAEPMGLETCGLDEAPTSPTWFKSLADDAASRMCQVHMWESLVNYYWQ